MGVNAINFIIFVVQCGDITCQALKSSIILMT